MCFSAEASFSGALVLGIVGGAALKSCISRSQYFLAAIPLLFALQQLSEGFIWLHLSYGVGSETVFMDAQRGFLLFAFFIWPIWVALSLAVLETIRWRQILLYLNLACGIVLSLLNFSNALMHRITVQPINHSLHYTTELPYQMEIYFLIVLLPCFISSLKKIWAFGMIIACAFPVALYFYEFSFISVWCFFAAIVSLSIYKIIKINYPKKCSVYY